MKNIIIIALLMLVSCQKDGVAPIKQKPTTPTPIPIKCDKEHYGDSCKKMYIDHYLGNYILINNNILRQTYPSTATKYIINTVGVRIVREWDGVYMYNIWGEGERTQLYSTDSINGFYSNMLPSYGNLPILLSPCKFELINDTFRIKEVVKFSDGRSANENTIDMKLVRR